MPKLRLFTPGPTMVPEEVLLEMARPIEHHRTQLYRDWLKECTENLQYLFQTKGTCLTLTGSGTAAAEGAIVSIVPPGRKALVCHGGKFAERWRDVCKRFKLDHVEYEYEYGRGADPARVAEFLKADPKIGAVITVHSETSTCALTDVAAIAKLTRERDCLLMTDCITSVGCLPFKMDEWGIDIAVTGSQKALMLPPGLAFVAVSDRAWKVIESFEAPLFYNNLRAFKKSLADWDAPWTPANTLVRGLRVALAMIRKEGLESIWTRTARLAKATRAAATALGLTIFAKDAADSVTGINTPAGIDNDKWRKSMKSRFGVQLADGQGQLKGKMVRISHMGFVDDMDTLTGIAAMELALREQGFKAELGAGSAAFLKAIAG
ncbi:MAG: alanine--glyoxylate aminotransferase family protein [Phycisphaerae bacterium]